MADNQSIQFINEWKRDILQFSVGEIERLDFGDLNLSSISDGLDFIQKKIQKLHNSFLKSMEQNDFYFFWNSDARRLYVENLRWAKNVRIENLGSEREERILKCQECVQRFTKAFMYCLYVTEDFGNAEYKGFEEKLRKAGLDFERYKSEIEEIVSHGREVKDDIAKALTGRVAELQKNLFWKIANVQWWASLIYSCILVVLCALPFLFTFSLE